MHTEPKYFVFLACPPGTHFSSNLAANHFAAIIEPDQPETFLCHWINQSSHEQPHGLTNCLTVFEGCRKLVMLLSLPEFVRLERYCRQFYPQTGVHCPYAPRLVPKLTLENDDVWVMYRGLCQINHNRQNDLYWWNGSALGLPYNIGVRWTELTFQIYRRSSRPSVGMPSTSASDSAPASYAGQILTSGYMMPPNSQHIPEIPYIISHSPDGPMSGMADAGMQSGGFGTKREDNQDDGNSSQW